MRWPRLFPLPPFTALPTPDGHAWCTNCRTWRRYGVLEPVTNSDGDEIVPAFVVCQRCGGWLEYDLEAA